MIKKSMYTRQNFFISNNYVLESDRDIIAENKGSDES